MRLFKVISREYKEDFCNSEDKISFAFGDSHLSLVEEEIKKIVKEALTIRMYEMVREEAITFYQQGNMRN